MTNRLRQISRRALVKLGTAGAVLTSTATAGLVMFVEACSSDSSNYGYGYGNYGDYGGYGYGAALLQRGHQVMARWSATSKAKRQVDLG